MAAALEAAENKGTLISEFLKEVFMPRGDGTGPNGQGSRTGRGMGFCSGLDRPGFMNFGNPNYGFRRGGFPRDGGMGRGFGGGRGNYWNTLQQNQNYAQAPIQNPPQEKECVEQEIKMLQNELSEMESYLKELKNKKEN